jgi:UDP-N-acetylmuramyl pentapeptide synthase
MGRPLPPPSPAELNELRERLHAALLEGSETAQIRRQIAAAENRKAEAAAAITAADEAVRAALAASTAAAAAIMVAASRAALADRMAALQPPTSPLGA